PVVDPQTVHQAKFSMGTVLGLIATRGGASVVDCEEAAFTDDVIDVRNRVHMHLDEEVDDAYPKQWIGKVTVTTRDGNTYDAKVLEPKGDPDNTLSRAEIEQKDHISASFTQAATAAEVDQAIEKIWHLTKSSQFNGFF